MKWRAALALLTAVSLSVLAAAQQATFRSGVDVVTLDVAVFDRNKPVSGLTAKDFLVRDSGVQQTIEMLPSSDLPVDLTLALDTSGSMSDSVEAVKRQVESASVRLGAEDQLRLLTFSWKVAEVFPMQRVTTSLPFDKFSAGGATSLCDALAATLMRQRRPGRGEIAIVLTDAVDTSSAMSMRTVQELARRSDVLLYIYVVRSPQDVQGDARFGRRDYTPLSAVATETGGQLDVVLADNQVARALERALTEFRSRYTLRYTATDVTRPGWHELAVAINRPGRFEVRARRGYFGR